MIYTVTLNPALDRSIVVEDLVADDANRIIAEERYAAGKGVDTSRVIAELGGTSTALGFIGGFDGLEFEGRLINHGVLCRFTNIAGETRTNIHILSRKTKQQTSINAAGPEIAGVELGMFAKTVRDLHPKPTFVAIAGSIPRGVTERFYAQLVAWCKEQGARVILDADKEAFRHGVSAGPWLVKPNSHELVRYAGTGINTVGDILAVAEKMLAGGVEVVCASRGAAGVVVVSENERFALVPPQVEAQSTTGAGDSLVAGIIHGLSQGKNLRQACTLGVACGAACAMTPGTELVHRSDVERLLPKVQMEEI